MKPKTYAAVLAGLYRKCGKRCTEKQAAKILRDAWRDSGLSAGYIVQTMRKCVERKPWDQTQIPTKNGKTTTK